MKDNTRTYFEHLESDLAGLDVLCAYAHGSRVYGNCHDGSDWDHEVVVGNGYSGPDQITCGDRQYSLFEKSRWEAEAASNSVLFCECFFLPDELKYKEDFIPAFELEKEKIRSAFSRKASNSWVKCKKKLTVKKDYAPYIGKKSLWHAFRILDFGCQILETGRICDYSSMNALYPEIMGTPDDWDAICSAFKPRYNTLKSRFRAFDRM